MHATLMRVLGDLVLSSKGIGFVDCMHEIVVHDYIVWAVVERDTLSFMQRAGPI